MPDANTNVLIENTVIMTLAAVCFCFTVFSLSHCESDADRGHQLRVVCLQHHAVAECKELLDAQVRKM